MEQQTIGGTNTIITQGKAYFQSQILRKCFLE